MYVQVPKFYVRAFIFGAFVFIHLCLLYSLTTCISYDTSQQGGHVPPTFFVLGGNGMFVPPTPLFHIPINYLVDTDGC